MSLELIIFDCDGVILESVDAKLRAFGRVGADFGPEAADRLTLYHKLHLGVSRSEKFAWLYREYLGREILPQENDDLCTRFASYCLDEVSASALVPGIREVLEAWKGRIPMYVASGTPEGELQNILLRRDLAGYFDGIRGFPPNKQGLLSAILKQTGASPSSTLMVGDGSTDQYAAEAVGSLFYGRGEAFRDSGYPWHEDMTQLNEYLTTLYQTP
jgi:phosphoglycolate phosphatase-like HAD superfamily hydrolase